MALDRLLRLLAEGLAVAACEMALALKAIVLRHLFDSLETELIAFVWLQQQLAHAVEADGTLQLQWCAVEMLLASLEQGCSRLVQQLTEGIDRDALARVGLAPMQHFDRCCVAGLALFDGSCFNLFVFKAVDHCTE